MSRRIVNIEPGFKTGYYSSSSNHHQRTPQPQPPTPSRQETPKHPQPITESIPLELGPTIRTLKGYGRRMYALGGLRGARALEQLVHDLMPHLGKVPELVDIILSAKQEAESIRTESTKGASFEQDDEDDED